MLGLKELLLNAFKDGLVLVVKYGLLVLVILWAFSFAMQTRQLAINGDSAAAALNEFINKGWLPNISNGQVPQKVNNEEAPSN